MSSVRKARRLRHDKLTKAERKRRLDGFLRKYPYITRPELRQKKPYDFNVVYGGNMESARRGARTLDIYLRHKQEEKANIAKESRMQVNAFLREMPNASRYDIAEAGLSGDLRKGYEGRLNDARESLGMRQRRGGWPHNNLYEDLWDDNFNAPYETFDEVTAAAIRPMLDEREFGIAVRYYGFGCKTQTLREISKLDGLSHESVRVIIKNKILGKLEYRKNQRSIAVAILPYVSDKGTRRFLRDVRDSVYKRRSA